jgi:nicotinamide mononucleotide transporter
MLHIVLEYSAVLFSLVAVWLTVKRVIWCWPISILAVLLTAWVYLKAGLFAEMALQAYYLAAAIWGWVQWASWKQSLHRIPIQAVSVKRLLPFIGLFALLGLLLGLLFDRYTLHDTPYFDSMLAAGSLLATALMVKRVIQNWLFWILIDSASILLYLHKELYGFALLFFIYTLLAYKGWRDWNIIFKTESSVSGS